MNRETRSYESIVFGSRQSKNATQVVEDIIQSTMSLLSNKVQTQTRTKVEDHIRILATLLPDELIYKDRDQNDNLNGVLLFVDISGFTDLCEKYNRLGKGGPSRLTQVLNSYIGAMVQEIMSYNGDILKFSGDAFIALWKCNDDVSMSDVVHAAIDCALGIQRSHGTFKTEVEIVLRVKIALAAGPVTFTVIGDSNFMILGSTMFDVKRTAYKCGPGDIIISNSIKMFLSHYEYILESIPNTNIAKILRIGPDWTPSTISNQFELFDSFAIADNKKTDIDEESEMIVLDDDIDDKPTYCSFMLRPSLDYAVSRNLNSYLRKFIIPPVVKAIDLNEPLDYLTEMRQVVIVFINVVVKETLRMHTITQVCNATYAIVCDMVIQGGGCVNKASMFDKDLMFLVIFGLRGLKHSLEAQKALYCATNIFKNLQRIPHVESVSVGVCTGKTYCGVVGHPIRKEYTVIGRTVNKAARLMVAYPDMVSCDRQTFLQSQLQARHFILQPIRILKGFLNVGPIYKFLEQTTDQELKMKKKSTTIQYPILDRETEMELFFYLLMMKQYGSDISFLARQLPILDIDEDYGMMVVKSHAREGKTRLLYEISYFVEDAVSYVLCNFSKSDTTENFKLVQQMFEEKCNLTEPDIQIRTENVAKFMHPFKVPEFLCALNEILLVDFEVTNYYLRLTDDQKYYVQRKMLKYLCVKGFRENGLLIVDNIDYMDEKSWSMIKVILNTGIMFVIATFSSYRSFGSDARIVLQRQDVKIIKLEPIKKVYHAGLICQFLNVMGIDLELERYIQEHSHGLPGWIECFLATLSHSNGITIVKMEKREALAKGLVIPPYDMISRSSEETRIRSSSVQLIDSKDGSFTERFDLDIEDWTIYYESIKDTDRHLSHNIPEVIDVCLIPNNVSLEDMDTEDILDVTMIQTYDSLKFQEQLLLKCSSILGNSFSRNMLEYVMQSQSLRKNAEAIQRLFEIHVFSCARAKHTDGAIQIDHYLTNPNEYKEAECYCIGFPIHASCKLLPKYANCGYIRFREPTFRQMLVNLLTDSQANLYHVRSMWFLESHTRRCLSCGLGYFTNLIGQSNDDGMKRFSIDQMPSVIITRSSAENSITARKSGSIDARQRNLTFGFIKDLQVTKDIFEKSTNIGLLFDIRVRTFADNNLINCECESILITMYKKMIEHCQETEINDKLMSALLEYATLCIRSQNITVAFTLLEKATELLDKTLKYEYPEPDWQVPLTRGRIMLLLGQLHIERTAFDEAEIYLMKALNCYNLDFPRNKLHIKIKTKINEFKQKLIVEYFPHRYIGSRNDDICMLAEQTADVMSSLYMLYRRKMCFDKAYLASIWGMNEALRSDSNFAILCTAYANLLNMDLVFSRRELTKKLEDMALNMCYRKHTRLEKHELEVVAKLYGSIFCRKYLCDNMLESLKIGSIVVQLNSPQFGGTYRWLMLPMMLKALMFTYLTVQAALLIRQMMYYKKIVQTHFAPMMYYTLCLEFRLYTTHSIESFSEVNSQCMIKLEDYTKRILSTIEMRYDVVLWLWYVRRGDWESAEGFSEHIEAICKWPYSMEPTMVYVFIHILEGLLIIIVRQINICDEEGLKKNEVFVKNLLKNLEKITERLVCLRSRFLLLKAYWCMIYNKETQAFKLLDKASAFAKKCGVLYDIDWIEHTRELWIQPRTSIQLTDAWQTATDTEVTDIDWDNITTGNPYYPFYSFFLPLCLRNN